MKNKTYLNLIALFLLVFFGCFCVFLNNACANAILQRKQQREEEMRLRTQIAAQKMQYAAQQEYDYYQGAQSAATVQPTESTRSTTERAQSSGSAQPSGGGAQASGSPQPTIYMQDDSRGFRIDHTSAVVRPGVRFIENSKPAEVVDIVEILGELETSSEVWDLIMDTDAKVAIVEKYIKEYRKRGILILKPAADYVHLIDIMSKEDPGVLGNPFYVVLKLFAIMEYDYDNGMDRDQMARELLGPEAYETNLRRMGIQP